VFRVALCDDETAFLEKEKRMINDYLGRFDLDYKIYAFSSGDELIQEASVTNYDLIMLDVEMPAMDGMEVARRLREKGIMTQIAFISAYVNYSTFGYHVNALRFIVKDNDIRSFIEECIGHVLRTLDITNRLIDVEFTVGKRQIKSNDILYLQNRGNYTYYIFEPKRNEELCQRIPIKRLTKSMEYCEFVSISAKESVNLYHVKSVMRYKVELDNGECLDVSQKRYNDVKNAFTLFVRGKDL